MKDEIFKIEVLEWSCMISFVIFLFTLCVVANYFKKNMGRTENVKIETGSIIQVENGKFENSGTSFKKW